MVESRFQSDRFLRNLSENNPVHKWALPRNEQYPAGMFEVDGINIALLNADDKWIVYPWNNKVDTLGSLQVKFLVAKDCDVRWQTVSSANLPSRKLHCDEQNDRKNLYIGRHSQEVGTIWMGESNWVFYNPKSKKTFADGYEILVHSNSVRK